MLVTKDGHNDYLSVESFSLTSLSEFASSKFVISSLRSFGADNVFHHFMHRQFRWHRSRCFAFSIFLISGLQNSVAYNAFSYLFAEQCCPFVTKDGHNDYLQSKGFYSACYHFIHHQCCLLVNKNRHNLCLGVGRFVDFVLSVCF